MARLVNYMVYGNALAAFACKEDEVMLHGGVNTGKTLCNFKRADLFAQVCGCPYSLCAESACGFDAYGCRNL